MMTKKAFLIILLLTGLFVTPTIAGGTVKITFKYKFTNIVEGYDHTCRMKVYVDGSVAGTSESHKESEERTFTVEIRKGNHTLRAVIETEYEGTWEEHTIINEYSIDCIYEKTMNFAKKNTNIHLEFDINSETIVKKK